MKWTATVFVFIPLCLLILTNGVLASRQGLLLRPIGERTPTRPTSLPQPHRPADFSRPLLRPYTGNAHTHHTTDSGSWHGGLPGHIVHSSSTSNSGGTTSGGGFGSSSITNGGGFGSSSSSSNGGSFGSSSSSGGGFGSSSSSGGGFGSSSSSGGDFGSSSTSGGGFGSSSSSSGGSGTSISTSSGGGISSSSSGGGIGTSISTGSGSGFSSSSSSGGGDITSISTSNGGGSSGTSSGGSSGTSISTSSGGAISSINSFSISTSGSSTTFQATRNPPVGGMHQDTAPGAAATPPPTSLLANSVAPQRQPQASSTSGESSPAEGQNNVNLSLGSFAGFGSGGSGKGGQAADGHNTAGPTQRPSPIDRNHAQTVQFSLSLVVVLLLVNCCMSW